MSFQQARGSAGALFEILVFQVAEQSYGLDVKVVRELIRAVEITPLPQAPLAIEGVINLRGQIVPVLDLRRRFNLPRKGVDPSEHFILATVGEHAIAVRADRVLEIALLRTEDVAEAKGVIPYSEYIAGVAKLRGGLVLLHDLRSFMSQGELSALEKALPER